MRRTILYFMAFALSLPTIIRCGQEEILLTPPKMHYQTEHVVLVVIDGPRYSETWATKTLIPFQADSLAPQGTFFSNFRNQGHTFTVAGHTAITTGFYQMPNNDGTEIPLKPSLFQYFLEQTQLAPSNACLVTSKDKLQVLSDCRQQDYRGRFNPFFSCGLNGSGRPDSITFNKAVETLRIQAPRLLLVQLSGPDAEAHKGNYPGYINAIQETDSLVYALWKEIQQNPQYRNKTSLLITNDHGRHIDGHKDGFKSHGDGCEGCRHISLLALGPDFQQGTIIQDAYEQIDIAPTIAQILQFKIPSYGGAPISPLVDYGEPGP